MAQIISSSKWAIWLDVSLKLSHSSFQVQIRQDKSNAASTTESPVNLGTGPLTLAEVKLSTKQQIKRLKRRRKGAAAEDDDTAEDEAEEQPGTDLTAYWMLRVWKHCNIYPGPLSQCLVA